MNRKYLLTALSGLLVPFFVGCASDPSNDDASEPAASEDAIVARAQVTCPRGAYEAGLDHYVKAVNAAKLRARGEVCDDGTLSGIANELAKATADCAAFEEVVATSPWAAPVRNALKGNLALAIVTGKVVVRDDDGHVVWKGLADALPGTKVYGPAPGVYGNVSDLTFEANGKATLVRYEMGVAQTPEKAIWKVGAAKGDAIEISITIGATTTKYVLRAPGADDGLYLHIDGPDGEDDFWSMPSECEA